MKIGIFGDSFADPVNAKIKNDPRAWFNIFANKFSDQVSIELHGMSASSIFYSYQKFLQNYHKYELIVFLVTTPDRYPKSLTLSHGQEHHFCGIGAIENVRKILGKRITLDDERILRHLEGYFIMNVHEYCMVTADLMLNNMSFLHPQVIFYPCFSDSFTKERQEKENIPKNCELFEMYKRQLQQLKIPEEAEKKELDTIIGHLVHEYNDFFANLLYKKVISGKWDFTGYDDIKTIAQPKEYYYEFI